MIKRTLLHTLCIVGSLAALGAAQSQPRPDARAVEDTVRQYFDHLSKYDFAAMRSMATPTFETLDGGVRLTHPEFEDYVRGTAQKRNAVLEFELTDFNTQVAGDVAYTTYFDRISGSGNLDAMVLKRIGGKWLIDRFMHMPIASGPEQVMRQYYHYIKAYNHDKMREMATPNFEIIYSRGRLDRAGFEKVHRAEEQQLGPAASRPDRYLYELSDVRTEEAGDTALISFKATNTETTRKDGKVVPVFYTRYFCYVVLRREGPTKRWLLDRFVSMPEPKPTAQ